MPAPSSPNPVAAAPQRARRRTVVATAMTWASAGAVLVVAGGCEAGSSDDAPGSTGSSAAPGSSSEAAAPTVAADADAEVDLALVADARRALATQTGLVRRATRTHGALSEPLAGLLAVHQTHDRTLAGAEPAATDAPPADPATSGSPTGSTGGASGSTPAATTKIPDSPDAALTYVRERERALQREFVELAGVARSGALAQLFASMSAAIAQRLQRLPASVEDDE